MIAVVQRVRTASVRIGDQIVGQIDAGLVVLVSIETADADREINFLCEKILNLRIFPSVDCLKPYDRSVIDIGGAVLVISNFTVAADTRYGRRPSLSDAMKPDAARPVFDRLLAAFRESSLKVATGEFGADMLVTIENEGPSTWLVSTRD